MDKSSNLYIILHWYQLEYQPNAYITCYMYTVNVFTLAASIFKLKR